jgi:anti-sigma regulatory factor (Ser/Thr protein kinase)
VNDEERATASVTVPGRVESVRPAAAFLVGIARNLHVPNAGDQMFEVAIVEALSNAIKHNPRDGHGSLQCDLEVSGRLLTIRVLDEAARAPVALSVPNGAIPWSDATADAWETIPDSGYGTF